MQAFFDSIATATTSATSAIFGAYSNGAAESDNGTLYVPRPKIFTSSQTSSADHQQGGRRLKVLIRGARKTGKSTLFRRLQGLPAVEGITTDSGIASSSTASSSFPYTPSTAIDVMRFSWSRNSISASLDVWDVVDHGTPQPLASSGYSFTSNSIPSNISKAKGTTLTEKSVVKGSPKGLPMLPIDATTIDVYRGGGECDLVIFLFDRSRRETFDYVCEEVKRVPRHVPIIIGSNFSDKSRCASGDEEAGSLGVSYEDEQELLASISPALSPFVQHAMCGAHFSAAPTAFAVPPLLISFCLPCGYGMRPLHAAFESVVAFHRAKELETQSKICYELAAKAQSDAMKEEEEQTFKSYKAVLRMMDRQNGTTESATIPAGGGSPEDDSEQKKKRKSGSTRPSNRPRDPSRSSSSISSYSTALSTTSEESLNPPRQRNGNTSRLQAKNATVVEAPAPTSVSRPAPPKGFQQTRLGVDASILDTNFAVASPGGTKHKTIDDFLADVAEEDEDTKLDYPVDDITYSRPNAPFLHSKSTARGTVSATQDSVARRERLAQKKKEEEAELLAQNTKARKGAMGAGAEHPTIEVKHLARQFEQHLETNLAANASNDDSDAEEKSGTQKQDAPSNGKGLPWPAAASKSYQNISLHNTNKDDARHKREHKEKKKKKDKSSHENRTKENTHKQDKNQRKSHRRNSSSDSDDSFSRQFQSKGQIKKSQSNPIDSRYNGISSSGATEVSHGMNASVPSYQNGSTFQPSPGGYLGNGPTSISSASIGDTQRGSKPFASHVHYYDALPTEGKGLLQR